MTLLRLLLVTLAACAVSAAASAPLAGARPQPGPFVRDCPGCPELRVLPGGSFLMGAAPEEAGRQEGETPQRRVTVRAFAIGRFPVTRGQWAAFVKATDRPTVGGCAWASATRHRPDPLANWSHLDFSQDDNHPVVCVTWDDARAYAAWLSQRTGHRYRLPTEAEWEYAARGGTTGAYAWGAVASHERANYGKDACCEGEASGRDRWVQTSPVGAFPPNPFGLYDMNGNVMQWTQDCLHDYREGPLDGSAYETPNPLVAGPLVSGKMVGADSCAYRMLRGGDWGNPPAMIRSASRNYAPAPGQTLALYRSAGLGFRVARSLD